MCVIHDAADNERRSNEVLANTGKVAMRSIAAASPTGVILDVFEVAIEPGTEKTEAFQAFSTQRSEVQVFFCTNRFKFIVLPASIFTLPDCEIICWADNA